MRRRLAVLRGALLHPHDVRRKKAKEKKKEKLRRCSARWVRRERTTQDTRRDFKDTAVSRSQ